MDSGCSSTLTIDTEFFIATASPWGVTAKRDTEVGWAIKRFCYKCVGLAQSGFSRTNFVNYSVRQVRNCATHMPNAASQPGTQILDYSATTTTKVIPITDIFSSFIDEADCGTVTCVLRYAGCVTAFSNANVVIGGSFDITIKRNVVAGHGQFDICVHCSSTNALNSVTTVATYDNWSIKQYKDCTTALTN